MAVDGLNFRRIGRLLNIDHQTVSNWVTADADDLPDAPPAPETSATVELDELYSFVGKKNDVYVITAVDRATRGFVGWTGVWERTPGLLQAVVDQAPQARTYFSDGFLGYRDLGSVR